MNDDFSKMAWRLAGYQARIQAGKGLTAREWDDMDRLEHHFKEQERQRKAKTKIK